MTVYYSDNEIDGMNGRTQLEYKLYAIMFRDLKLKNAVNLIIFFFKVIVVLNWIVYIKE